MRRVSLNARAAHDAAASDEVEVVLIRISHEALDGPILLSTDNTERLSIEPLAYGTRSTWLGATDPFQFVLMDALLPDDVEDAPASASLVLELVHRDMAAPLWATTSQATVDLAVVFASSPDLVELEVLGLSLVNADADSGQVVLSMTRTSLADEPLTAVRMTRQTCPGLFR